MKKIPDRVSADKDSPFFMAECVNLGVKFDGVERPNDVREFCVSEGWIRKELRMANGKLKRERGNILCFKMRGKVEPYWKG